MAQQYRSKGSIGLIVPPRCNETMLEEAFRLRPEGLTWCVAGLGLPELTERDFEVALRATEEAARELAARKVSVIVQGGLLLHVAQGPSFHRELQRRLQAAVGDGIPVVTDRALVIAALQALGARRLSVITPYRQQIRDNLVHSLESHDVAVVSARGADLQLAEFITGLDFDSAYDGALASFAEQPDTDAFYLACPQWPVVGNVARIEAATGKPVITQLTVILWWALQVLRLPDRVRGYGRLLEQMPAASSLEATAR